MCYNNVVCTGVRSASQTPSDVTGHQLSAAARWPAPPSSSLAGRAVAVATWQRGMPAVSYGFDLTNKDSVVPVNDEDVKVTAVLVLGPQVDGSGKGCGRCRVGGLVEVVSKAELGNDEHHLSLGVRQLVQRVQDPSQSQTMEVSKQNKKSSMCIGYIILRLICINYHINCVE